MRTIIIPNPRAFRVPGQASPVTLSLPTLLSERVWGDRAWRVDEASALAFSRIADAFHLDDEGELVAGALVVLSDADHERLCGVLRSLEFAGPAAGAATRLVGAILTASAEPPK
jgi:hypothetical protein